MKMQARSSDQKRHKSMGKGKQKMFNQSNKGKKEEQKGKKGKKKKVEGEK